MFKLLVTLSLLALLVAGIDARERQPRQVSTVTRTTTSTSTQLSTITSTTRTVCVKLVNATSACRRKRQYWIDTPVVLALDAELDSFAQQFINPSQVMSVQATQMPTLKQAAFYPEQVNAAPLRSSVARPSAPEQFYNPYMFRDGVMPFRPFRPFRPAYNLNPYGASPYGVSPYGVVPEGRLGAVGLVNLFAQILGVAPTTTTTITATTSATTTSFVTTTGTLVISGCSPAGLAFSTCPASG